MQSNIRQLRKEKHISQTELGRILGVSQQMVSRIEKDRERIQIRQLIILSEYFGVSTDYILNYYRDNVQDDPEGIAQASIATDEDMAQLRDKLFRSDDRTLFYLFMCMQSYMQHRSM